MPLILPSNKLSFPWGRCPGIDFSHPAFGGFPLDTNNFFSVVAINNVNNYLNVGSGTVPAPSTAGSFPTGTFQPSIGYAPKFVASTPVVLDVKGQLNVAAPTNVAAAFIFYVTSVASTAPAVSVATDSGASASFGHGSTGGLQIFSNGSSVATSGLSIAANTPYFACCYADAINQNWLLLNLATGKILTAATATAITWAGSGASTWAIGGWPSSSRFNGQIAAAFLAENLQGEFSLAQMKAWARDPWGFWYPPDLSVLIFGFRSEEFLSEILP